MIDLLPCRMCGSHQAVEVGSDAVGYFVVCPDCGARTRRASTESEARRKWVLEEPEKRPEGRSIE